VTAALVNPTTGEATSLVSQTLVVKDAANSFAGEAGVDTFNFQQGFATTNINNFDTSKDVIQFNPVLFANYNSAIASTQQVGANTVISYNANETITLANVAASSLSPTNFKFA
jgi:c-di-AMP phosphodiesterase-like protein